MISDAAKNSFSEMLHKSIQDTLVKENSDTNWDIETVTAQQNPERKEFVIITISSLIFRVLIAIHFSRDQQTVELIASKMGLNDEELKTSDFYDYFGEFANLFCGSIKRDLSKCFPYLGMSTPDRLPKKSFPFIHDLENEGYQLKVRAQSESGVALSFSLSAYVFEELDFVVETEDEEEVFGELEFF